jgi:type II secretory pathway pseudopilin PulG
MKSSMRTPRSEAGFALIEVVVAAAVLAIVALAVLSGMDGAMSASAREKARAVAANLAERDQERLRTMPISLLANPPQQGIVEVEGIKYEIKSETRWITDDFGGDPECGASSNNSVQYMQIRTTVTSKVVGKNIPPVTVDSLVAPTTEHAENHGALGVKVVDRTSTKGVAGINVTAASATHALGTKQTDAKGCVVFNAVPEDTYTITLNHPGYINRDGEQQSQTTHAVVAKTLSFANMIYDLATKADVTVTSHTPGSTWSPAASKPSKASAVSMTNGTAVGWMRTFTPSQPTGRIEAANLFPFAENSYAIFSGACGYASPDTYKPANTNYFTQTNPAATLLADPAQFQPQPVGVRQPPFNVRIMRGRTTTAFADGDVTVYAQLQKPSTSTDPCPQPIYTLTTKPWPGGAWGSAPRTSPDTATTATNGNHFVSQVGTDFDPGMPFGRYKICLRHSGRGKMMTGDYDNTSPDGGPKLDLDVGGSWQSGEDCSF